MLVTLLGMLAAAAFAIGALHHGRGRARSEVSGGLAARAPGRARFGISGRAHGLQPGKPRPLNLKLSNPNRVPIAVERLSARLLRVSTPRATGRRPCSRADFSLRQYRGHYPLRVPRRAARTLAGLGIAPALRPQITLRDRPVNQNGCERARVTIAYGGRAWRR